MEKKDGVWLEIWALAMNGRFKNSLFIRRKGDNMHINECWTPFPHCDTPTLPLPFPPLFFPPSFPPWSQHSTTSLPPPPSVSHLNENKPCSLRATSAHRLHCDWCRTRSVTNPGWAPFIHRPGRHSQQPPPLPPPPPLLLSSSHHLLPASADNRNGCTHLCAWFTVKEEGLRFSIFFDCILFIFRWQCWNQKPKPNRTEP